jgi:ABC-type uncharacterized transport system auxiliary subunit
MKTPWAHAVLALHFGLLAACSGGLRSSAPPEQIYLLHAVSAPAPGVVPVTGALAVPRPVAHPGLDHDRITLTRPDNELDHFANSRWGASLPKVVGALAVESLAGSGRFAAVISGEQLATHSDYEMLLTIRHFEAVYLQPRSAPQVHVALACTLTAGTPRRVLGSCDAEVQRAAAENRQGAIIQALQQAAQQALSLVGEKAAALALNARGAVEKP